MTIALDRLSNLETDNLSPLPDGWVWTILGNVVDVETKQVLPYKFSNQLFNYLALENIESGTGRIINFSPTKGENIKSNKFVFTPEHVLYGKLRPYLLKVVTPDFEGISATDILPLRPKVGVLTREFLKWWLLSPSSLEYVMRKQTGVKMPRLRSGDLQKLPIPLPPLSEQERIVAKLEALLQQSRGVHQALDRIPPLLRAFRRAVLEAAFRGELSERQPDDEPAQALLERIRLERHRKWEEDLRAKGKDPAKYHYKEPAPPDTSNLPDLPEGWVWTRFEELLAELKNGHFSKAPSQDPPGIPILRINAVRPSSVNLDEVRYLRKELNDLMDYQLRDGDLLFTRYNGSLDLVGVCAMVRDIKGVIIHPDKLIRARFFENTVLPDYLELYFATNAPRRIIEDKAKSSAGQTGISGKDLKDVPIILPSKEEQIRIVARIKALFAQADLIQNSVLVAQHRLDTLNQAALARAFRGDL